MPSLHNCVTVKAVLYIGIASLTTLMSDLGDFKAFSEINPVKAALIGVNFILQGMIAWRAFLDQSVGRARIDAAMKQKEEKQLELIVEGPK